MFKELSKKFFVVGAILALSACSGDGGNGGISGSDGSDGSDGSHESGSGDAGPVSAPAADGTYPIASAMVNKLTNGMNTTVDIGTHVVMSASPIAVTGTGTFESSILTSATFLEQPAMSIVETFSGSLSVWDGGALLPEPLPERLKKTIYFDSNYNELGYTREGNVAISISNDPSYITVVTEQHPFPAAAKVNDTGLLNKATTYYDSTKTRVYSTTVSNYAVEADTSTSVIFNISTEYYGDGNSVLRQTEVERYRISATGNISFVSFQVFFMSKEFHFSAP